MGKIQKTTENPHGLSAKQKLVVEDMVRKIQKGKPLKATESTKKFYDVGSDNMAAVITSNNMANPDFREALMEGLEKKGILGRNSLIEGKLEEGLDATTKMGLEVDYRTRLEYIKEINKIAGVYAPEKKETKTLRLNVDVSAEELDKRIKSLQAELNEV